MNATQLSYKEKVFLLLDTFLIALGNNWSYVKKLDTGSGGASSGPAQNSAFKVFQNKVDKGADSPTETKLNTKHQNCIT